MRRESLTLAVLAGLLFWACGSEEHAKQEDQKTATQTTEVKEMSPEDKALWEKAKLYFQPLPETADINPDNPLNEHKVLLGKMLYYDPRLSLSGFISCNSCHNLATGGVDNLPTSIGHRWQLGPRNAPTVLNAALHTVGQFWDGRAKDVEEQAGKPITNPIEMAMPSEEFAVQRIASIPEYVELFKKAFPNEQEPLTYENIAKAIAAFERTLLTPSRFDEFLKGNPDALTEQEKRGLQTFIEVGCITCHTGPLLGGNMFQKFGLFGNYWEYTGSTRIDSGRYNETKNEADIFMFKVPSLRNITKTYPYFHDGSVWSLDSAIWIMAKVQLGKDLTQEQIEDIKAFLASLDGEVPAEALQVPELPPSTEKTPLPQR